MRKIRVYNIEVPLDGGDKAFYRAVLRRLGVDRNRIDTITMNKRALDTRKGKPRWNCTADVVVKPQFEELISNSIKDFRNIAETPEIPPLEFPSGSKVINGRPVIVGSGPGGLFAAYVLAMQGYKPLVIERGAPAKERLKQIGRFNSGAGELDTEANVVFGEGGAGTFSDGKLYTRKNRDPHLVNVLRLLVEHGAPDEILIDAAPHIGTDKLAPVVMALRETVERLGGEFRFRTRMEHIEINDGAVRAITANGERIETNCLLLATGHSARDVFRMLQMVGVALEAKPFQFGLRIEHPQEMIDEQQYRSFAGHPDLGAAEYFLTCAVNPNVGEVHSFCMCPGGIIVPSVHSEGELCINGMSFSLRSTNWANSGLVTTLNPADYGGDKDPLAGVRLQQRYEQMAFEAAGSDYAAPAQPAADFMTGLMIKRELPGSYQRGRRYTQLDTILPEQLTKALRYALPRFDKQIKGYAGSDGILHALESRASCPVRIPRNPDTKESVNTQGLYPVGEGAGFAGGIVSAALDGIHSAAAIMARFGAAKE